MDLPQAFRKKNRPAEVRKGGGWEAGRADLATRMGRKKTVLS